MGGDICSQLDGHFEIEDFPPGSETVPETDLKTCSKEGYGWANYLLPSYCKCTINGLGGYCIPRVSGVFNLICQLRHPNEHCVTPCNESPYPSCPCNSPDLESPQEGLSDY